MTALLFPGQGTQRVGMGQAIFRRFADGAAVLAEATRITGLELAGLLRHGPAGALRRTEHAQVAVTTVNLAALAALRARGASYDVVAGHSVGVLAALAAADALTPAQVLWLASRRGAIMGALPPGGAMAAVNGTDAPTAAAIVRDTAERTGRPVVVALVNDAARVVVSGDAAAVADAVRALLAAGAVSAAPLDVSHAFHSPLMDAATPGWADTVAALPLRDARIPVLADTTGRPLTSRGDLRDYLVEQLTRPVRWDLVCRRLYESGVTEAVEAGDSKVLRSFGRSVPALRIASLGQPHVVARLHAGEPLHPAAEPADALAEPADGLGDPADGLAVASAAGGGL